MAVRFAPSPAFLYRIGRAPELLDFPPLVVSGTGRYDDPKRERSVLYAAVDRRPAFLESLDGFRPDLAAVAERDAALSPETVSAIRPSRTVIPGRFFTRKIVRFSLDRDQRWLDVRSPETHAVLRADLGSELDAIGFGPRFVLGDLLSNQHRVTQLVAGWALAHECQGIAYASCHDPSMTCWAIFEGAAVHSIEPAQAIDRADPDLRWAASLWDLEIPIP